MEMYLHVREDFGRFMEVITVNINNIPNILNDLCACIGYFDGMHIGHQSLFHQVFQVTKVTNLQSAIITFDPDPWTVTKKQMQLSHLMTMNQRISLAEEFGFNYFIILHFDEEMASLSITQFHDLLNKLHVKTLVCGFDFHYGHFGLGNSKTLMEQEDFKVITCPEVKYLNQKISSTRIEHALSVGNIELVNTLLGRNFQVDGLVIHGRGLGRTIGFPTANIQYDQEQLIPKPGVYAGYVEYLGKYYRAILNIGHNPTFNLKEQLSLEVHILDLNADLYDENLKIQFCYYLRDEMKFHSREELIEQLSQDKQRSIQLLNL